MGITLKPITDIAAKWNRRASAAGPDYEAGIRAPKTDWANATKAAESAFEAGIQNAVSRKAFGKGVAEAGSEKWSRKALAVGPSRFGPGLTAGLSDYQSGFTPYRDVLERISLPPRGMRGDPANIERVRAIATALHTQKTGGA